MKKIMLMAAFIAAMTQAHAQKVVEETDLKANHAVLLVAKK